MSRSLRPVWVLALVALFTIFIIWLPPTLRAEPTSTQAPPSAGFLATYYAGRALQGNPILTRLEPVINWSYEEGGSPAPGVVPATDFSVRWEGWYMIDHPGAWTFSYTSDDGGRVWIDNELVIDLWYDHSPQTRVKTKEFGTGYHLIRVEYYQATGGMTSQLIMTPPGLYSDWQGEYFDNPFLLGEPQVRKNDVDINFNWGSGSPDEHISPDNFSARWTRLYSFAAGSYTFSATADDGIRVWIGDTLAINAWIPQQPKTYTATLYLDGTLPLRVEYFEQGGDALVNFFFKATNQVPVQAAAEAWQGKYFNNPNLTSPSVCDQAALTLVFNWGGKSPGCGIAGQAFSVRWESTRNAPVTSFYTVYVTVDDGARVFVDNARILDAWRAQAPTNYSTTVYLTAGPHTWRVEYFQDAGGAQLSLNIVQGVTLPPPPPRAASKDIVVAAGGAGWAQGGNPSAWQTAASDSGGTALWAKNEAFMQPLFAWGKWYPPLTEARNYEVFVFIPGGVATTKNARYWLWHDGQYDSVVVAQAAYKNQWVSLGTYSFAGEGGEFVTLSSVTYECNQCTTVVWDAVKFSPR